MTNPARVADLTGFDLMDPYFWIDQEQVLLLRHVPGPDPEEAGHFEALVHNMTTGRREPLEAFNAACAPLLRGTIMYVMYEGQPGREINYIAPPVISLPTDNGLPPSLNCLVAVRAGLLYH